MVPFQSLVARSMTRATYILAILWLIAGISSLASAEPGVTANEILFGQVAALDGPAGFLGREMRTGIVAAFEEANRAGGVKGRKLRLISEDDGYEPTKSIEAAKRLLSDGKIFALIGSVGTPTSAATQPITAEAGVPFLAPFTGAEFLREPSRSNVVNIRASYFQETETVVERLTKDQGIARIAILYQDDAFGRAGLLGVQRALDRRGMRLVAEASFERNTVAVKSAFLNIQRATPEAIILIGPYKPCAAFIKLAHVLRMNAVFASISFVGANSLADELGPEGRDVIVTQVVPCPRDVSLPAVADYRRALSAADPSAKPGYVSLEGYLAGRLTIAALEKERGDPNRERFLQTIFSNSFDFGGVTLSFGPSQNQGSAEVYITVLQVDGTLKPISHLLRKSSLTNGRRNSRQKR